MRLMEEIVSRANMMAAYHRVMANKGAAGIDRMTVEQLQPHLKEHWPRIREELLEGRYRPPPEGDLYYRIWDEDELGRFAGFEPAPHFEEFVVPRGFELPLDEAGNMLKTNVVTEEEPYEVIA